MLPLMKVFFKTTDIISIPSGFSNEFELYILKAPLRIAPVQNFSLLPGYIKLPDLVKV